ncbi:MAG: energy-coupling factor ABC transporter ATP-binding protein [Clostridia bacterium]
MINICDLSFKYKNSNNILNNINIEIQEGETVAIVGENGSGKSTLAKLMSGILKTKQGKIIIDNLDLTKREDYKEAIKKVGIVFQNPENQIIFNNIYDELSFALKHLTKEETKERIIKSLKKVKMYDYIDKDLYELSLGQKQRIAIAEILAKEPKYIIFDEPTTMIDSLGKEQIYDIIKTLKKEGYTIIYTTNLVEEILLADRILILRNGQIVNEIKKENLISSVDILMENNIKLPTIIEIALKLNIDLKEFTTEELINKIKNNL